MGARRRAERRVVRAPRALPARWGRAGLEALSKVGRAARRVRAEGVSLVARGWASERERLRVEAREPAQVARVLAVLLQVRTKKRAGS